MTDKEGRGHEIYAKFEAYIFINIHVWFLLKSESLVHWRFLQGKKSRKY